jgi:hypothetical protein
MLQRYTTGQMPRLVKVGHPCAAMPAVTGLASEAHAVLAGEASLRCELHMVIVTQSSKKINLRDLNAPLQAACRQTNSSTPYHAHAAWQGLQGTLCS